MATTTASIWKQVRPYVSTVVRFMHISYLEAKSDYQGTIFGVLWIPMSTLIFAGLLGMIFHSGGERPPVDFFLYVLSGYIIWKFISASISESTNIIQSKLDFAIHNNLSLAGLFAKMLADRFFDFGLNLALLVIAVIVFSPQRLGFNVLLFIPLLVMMAGTSLALSYCVNMLTLSFPDTANLIKAFMRMLFFATPIFWSVEDRSGVRLALEKYNPAAYFLRSMREVFGVEPVSADAWAITAAISVVVCIIGGFAFSSSFRFVRNLK
jgi:ABC-type polysaccharide/polyol phosphate export permease